jgi:hypothetical protein
VPHFVQEAQVGRRFRIYQGSCVSTDPVPLGPHRCEAGSHAGATLDAHSQDFFAKWSNEGIVDFASTFSELIILTASRTLMGAHGRRRPTRHTPSAPHLETSHLGGGAPVLAAPALLLVH